MESHNRKLHNRKKIAKTVTALVFSFLLTLCFTSCLLLIGCELGIFNGAIILRQLDKTDYYASVDEAIVENVSELLLPSGLPDTILDGVISEEEVRHDTKNAVKMSLKGQGYKADTRQLEARFRQNIQNYIEENGIQIGEKTEEGIEQLLEAIKKEYKRCMDFPFTKYFVRYQTAFGKFFLPAMALFLVMSVLICTVLLRMQRWKHRGMRYISYATLASAWMVGIPMFALMFSKAYTRINVSPKYLYDLMVGIVRADLMVFLGIFLFVLLAFGAELWLIRRMRRKAERRGR